MATITHWQLAALGACDDQRDIFKATFGAKAEVTEANARTAVAAGLDINWLAERVLTGPYREQYEAVRRQAWEQYEAVRRQAEEQYEAVRRQAEEQYEAVRRQAWEQYQIARALAFVNAYNAQVGEEPVNDN
jgi:hypothetical protein